MSNKLHELLAVESNLSNQAKKCSADLQKTFNSKRHLFEEKILQFTPNTEGAQPKIEAQSSIQSSVSKELEWIADRIAPALNAQAQIARANQQATASVEVDGQVIIKDAPATQLLELEKRLTEIQQLIASVPTLDPAKGFSEDPNRGKGVYRAREIVKDRTKKIQEPLELSPATKEHPAQVQLITVDRPVGEIREEEWSAMYTPSQKAEMIDRVEKLARAVRQARSRANDQEIDKGVDDGRSVMNYILG